MGSEIEKMQDSLVSIASELFRFRRVFEKAISKLEVPDQIKYTSQFSWFTKKVDEALNESDLRLVNLESKNYDPGMAVTPLNIDDFEPEDILYIAQMVEPIVMKNGQVLKMGTVVLERK